MSSGRKGLFMFLVKLAWKCRFGVPLLLTGTAALIGRAYMIQIRVHTREQLVNHEIANYIEEEEEDEDDSDWETDSEASWETLVEDVAFG